MGEVIQIRDLQAARERAQRRACGHDSIERALVLMRENLVWAAEQLRATPVDAQPELLERIEKLAATIRYGMLMLEEPSAGPVAGSANRRS
jgi:hypothetical protein